MNSHHLSSPSASGLAGFLSALAQPWSWRMAWRDSRTSRKKLAIFSLSIVLGVAALVAIGSLSRDMRDAVEDQAKSLLGADLSITSRSPFTPEQESLFKSLGGEQSRETMFSSMASFPKNGGTRLVQVRAIENGFPYYGNMETDPASAVDFRSRKMALAEPALLAQFGLKPGDDIKIGQLTLPLGGSLRKVPGENFAFASLAPRIYLPMELLVDTGLVKRGSLVRYRVYFRFPASTNVEKLVEKIKPELEKSRLSTDTVQERKSDLGESLDNLHRFLNLAAFIALLLGGVGIASAIQVHVQQKRASVAVLRCLGCSNSQAFAIYLIQAAALGFLGVIIGTIAGLLIQQAIPSLTAGMLPFPVKVTVHWPAVFRAMLSGLVITILFALLPLLAVRRITPLAVLRGNVDNDSGHDPARLAAGAAVVIAITGFAISQSEKWWHGLAFAGGLGIAFGALLGVAKLITWGARRTPRTAWPYVWRQGLSNLYRPQNRTVLLMICLGLGTFLILTLFLTHRTLMAELIPDHDNSRPNTILFDIQGDQTEGVTTLLRSQNLPVMGLSPVITMRLQSVKGVPVEKLLDDKKRGAPNWVLRREYRSTYRDHLVDSEKLVEGQWQASVTASEKIIPVSLERGIARELRVKVGDELVFDVQGLPITTRVASLREVDWRRVQSNFFVVFPLGVLEGAPGFFILSTRTDSEDASARLQRAVVNKYPNVSIIDLALILQTLDSVLSKISFVVRCMAFFTVATGVLVLAGAVLTGRYQRLQESVLLRTLGASRAQVLKILFAEYALLGLFASLTGVILSVGASWALAVFIFKTGFTFAFGPVVIATLAVSALTIVTGLLTSWGVTRRPPLEILRAAG